MKNPLHRMHAQLTLAIEQQHEARRCHDRAVAASQQGNLRLATEWQMCAAHHHDGAVTHQRQAMQRPTRPQRP